MVGAMAMETTHGMVLQSCMFVWMMPGKNQQLWPHVKKHALPWLYRSVSNYKAVRLGDAKPSSTALRPFLPGKKSPTPFSVFHHQIFLTAHGLNSCLMPGHYQRCSPVRAVGRARVIHGLALPRLPLW